MVLRVGSQFARLRESGIPDPRIAALKQLTGSGCSSAVQQQQHSEKYSTAPVYIKVSMEEEETRRACICTSTGGAH